MDLDLGHPTHDRQQLTNMSNDTTTPAPSGIARTVYPDNPAPSFEAWRRWITTGEDWTDEVLDPEEEDRRKFDALIQRMAADIVATRRRS
jgi:hypothetical protein